MKKYLLMSFLFLLVTTPVLVKNPIKAQEQQKLIADNQTTIITVDDNRSRNNQKPTSTPTIDNQNKNENKNQDNNSETNTKTQENDKSDQSEDKNLTKVF